MPFGVMSGVGRGMGVFAGGGDRRMGRGSFESNVEHPIVTNGEFPFSGVVILFREWWRRGSTQITLRFLVTNSSDVRNT